MYTQDSKKKPKNLAHVYLGKIPKKVAVKPFFLYTYSEQLKWT